MEGTNKLRNLCRKKGQTCRFRSVCKQSLFATVCFVMFVGPSFCPYEAAWKLPGGFSRKLILVSIFCIFNILFHYLLWGKLQKIGRLVNLCIRCFTVEFVRHVSAVIEPSSGKWNSRDYTWCMSEQLKQDDSTCHRMYKAKIIADVGNWKAAT